MTAIESILALDPCMDARVWLATLPPETSAADGVALCPRGDWLLWLASAVRLPIPVAAYRPAVVRAMGYAVTALRAAGLEADAHALAAVPADAPFETMRAAAGAAAGAAASAARAARVRRAARAALAAGAASWASASAAWAAVDEAAAARAAAGAAAWTSASAEHAHDAEMAEHALCAADVLGGLVENPEGLLMEGRRAIVSALARKGAEVGP